MDETSLGIPIPNANPRDLVPQLRMMVEAINELLGGGSTPYGNILVSPDTLDVLVSPDSMEVLTGE